MSKNKYPKTFGRFTLPDKNLSESKKIKAEILNYASVIVKGNITDVLRYQHEDDHNKKGYLIQIAKECDTSKEQICLNQMEFISLYTSMTLYMNEIVKKPLSEIQKIVSPHEPFKFNTSKKNNK